MKPKMVLQCGGEECDERDRARQRDDKSTSAEKKADPQPAVEPVNRLKAFVISRTQRTVRVVQLWFSGGRWTKDGIAEFRWPPIYSNTAANA